MPHVVYGPYVSFQAFRLSPHTHVVQQSADYAHIDYWANFLLTDSAHHGMSRSCGTRCTTVWCSVGPI